MGFLDWIRRTPRDVPSAASTSERGLDQSERPEDPTPAAMNDDDADAHSPTYASGAEHAAPEDNPAAWARTACESVSADAARTALLRIREPSALARIAREA